MSTTKNNSNGVKNSSSLAVADKAIKDYFKTAKAVNAFKGEVLSVDIYEYKVNIETKDYWILVYTDYINVQLKKGNFLGADMIDDITFINQNRHNIISVCKDAIKKAA